MKSILAVLIFLLPSVTLASATVGTIQAPNQYAWSENAGWINFAPDNGNIQVTDTVITGYAWDPIYGWLNLSPNGAGVKNDGQGNLSGSAWSQGAGWVNFTGVRITATGKFTGTARGATYGRMSFDCDTCNVMTDWRPAGGQVTPRPASNSGGVVRRILSWVTGTNVPPVKSLAFGATTTIGTTTTSATTTSQAAIRFARSLYLGRTGADVNALQKFLNTHGFPVAKNGLGSLGRETYSFGYATRAAVVRFQQARGIKPANGVVGPQTQAKILSLIK